MAGVLTVCGPPSTGSFAAVVNVLSKSMVRGGHTGQVRFSNVMEVAQHSIWLFCNNSSLQGMSRSWLNERCFCQEGRSAPCWTLPQTALLRCLGIW